MTNEKFLASCQEKELDLSKPMFVAAPAAPVSKPVPETGLIKPIQAELGEACIIVPAGYVSPWTDYAGQPAGAELDPGFNPRYTKAQLVEHLNQKLGYRPYLVMVTGHRPQKLGGFGQAGLARQARIKELLLGALIVLQHEHKNIVGISGMAIGVDQLFAEACLMAGIPYLAYVPCLGQDSKWSPETKTHYQELLTKAVVQPLQKTLAMGAYSGRAMNQRNTIMVRDADYAIAVWDGRSGGTGNCVNDIKRKGIPWTQLDPTKI
jgi:uncharacterized phage-like protein YoqJ